MEILYFLENQEKFKEEDRRRDSRLDMVKAALIAAPSEKFDPILYKLFPEYFEPDDGNVDEAFSSGADLDLTGVDFEMPSEDEYLQIQQLLGMTSGTATMGVQMDESFADQVEMTPIPDVLPYRLPDAPDTSDDDNGREWL